MDESGWTVNHIGVTDSGKKTESGENLKFTGVTLEILQYDYQGVVKTARISGLEGVLARTGPDKTKFHLSWQSCLGLMDVFQKNGMISTLNGKIAWVEANNAIEMVVKNNPY